MLARIAIPLVAVAATVLALVAVWPGEDGFGEREAEATALRWVGAGTADAARRDGDEWEVDVRRPDGSVVEVTIGEELELRGFDEELGAGHTLAPDELRGDVRDRAIRAAFAEVGPGRVQSVERDSSREIEVSVRRPDGKTVEVELDGSYRVVEVEPEAPDDE